MTGDACTQLDKEEKSNTMYTVCCIMPHDRRCPSGIQLPGQALLFLASDA
jgi:hypothetical protein